MSKQTIVLIRKPELLAKLSLSKSTLFNRINDGLLPPPISLGGRSVAWPEHEIDLVINARVAGKENPEIRKLVSKLANERLELFN